jgi:hypothetical protein
MQLMEYSYNWWQLMECKSEIWEFHISTWEFNVWHAWQMLRQCVISCAAGFIGITTQIRFFGGGCYQTSPCFLFGRFWACYLRISIVYAIKFCNVSDISMISNIGMNLNVPDFFIIFLSNWCFIYEPIAMVFLVYCHDITTDGSPWWPWASLRRLHHSLLRKSGWTVWSTVTFRHFVNGLLGFQRLKNVMLEWETYVTYVFVSLETFETSGFSGFVKPYLK